MVIMFVYVANQDLSREAVATEKSYWTTQDAYVKLKHEEEERNDTWNVFNKAKFGLFEMQVK